MSAVCNGFKIRSLNVDCQRVAVKSSVQTSWFLTYRKFGKNSRPEEYEIGFSRDELINIAFQSESGQAAIEIEPLGDAAGTIIAQSNRGPTRVLRVGAKYRYELAPREALMFRSERVVYPTNAGRGLAA